MHHFLHFLLLLPFAIGTITVKGYDGNPFTFGQHSDAGGSGRFIRTWVKFAFTSNYVTGGDTLDLTNGGTNGTVPPGAVSLIAVDFVGRGPTAGFTGAGGTMVLVPGVTHAPLTLADVAALKLKLLVGGGNAGVEYTAGAYGADVTGDELLAECIWARQ